jgi:hypothetical protein
VLVDGMTIDTIFTLFILPSVPVPLDATTATPTLET